MCAHAAVSRVPDPASRNGVRSEWRRGAATGMILLHCAKLEREYKCPLSMTCQCAHVQKRAGWKAGHTPDEEVQATWPPGIYLKLSPRDPSLNVFCLHDSGTLLPDWFVSFQKKDNHFSVSPFILRIHGPYLSPIS